MFVCDIGFCFWYPQSSNSHFYFAYLICILAYNAHNSIIIFVCFFKQRKFLIEFIALNRSLFNRSSAFHSQGIKLTIINQIEWIPLLINYNEKFRKQLTDFYHNEMKNNSSCTSNIFYINSAVSIC